MPSCAIDILPKAKEKVTVIRRKKGKILLCSLENES